MRRLFRWFQARFRLNLNVVCEMSEGLGPYEDYHDYDDNDPPAPMHFRLMTCRRCGKEFYI